MTNGNSTQLVQSGPQDVVLGGGTAQQVSTQFVTAASVQQPRSLAAVEDRIMQEADQAGEDFYYGWGAGKDRIEGASVGLAMAAVRNYGNCVIQMGDVQDTPTAWIFTASFVDLETGFTLQRQFRQSKRHIVYGKHDEARKEDIRFQIGQSKAVRNVVLNALPKWMTNRAVDRAKGGVRARLEDAITKKSNEFEGSLEKAQWAICELLISKLGKHNVSQDRVLKKFGRSNYKKLSIEDMIIIRGDLHALDNRVDDGDSLYPPIEEPSKDAGQGSQQDKLLDQMQGGKTDQSASPEDEGGGESPDQEHPSPSEDETAKDDPPAEDEWESADARNRAEDIAGCSDEKLLDVKQQVMAEKKNFSEADYTKLIALLDEKIASKKGKKK